MLHFLYGPSELQAHWNGNELRDGSNCFCCTQILWMRHKRTLPISVNIIPTDPSDGLRKESGLDYWSHLLPKRDKTCCFNFHTHVSKQLKGGCFQNALRYRERKLTQEWFITYSLNQVLLRLAKFQETKVFLKLEKSGYSYVSFTSL